MENQQMKFTEYVKKYTEALKKYQEEDKKVNLKKNDIIQLEKAALKSILRVEINKDLPYYKFFGQLHDLFVTMCKFRKKNYKGRANKKSDFYKNVCPNVSIQDKKLDFNLKKILKAKYSRYSNFKKQYRKRIIKIADEYAHELNVVFYLVLTVEKTTYNLMMDVKYSSNGAIQPNEGFKASTEKRLKQYNFEINLFKDDTDENDPKKKKSFFSRFLNKSGKNKKININNHFVKNRDDKILPNIPVERFKILFPTAKSTEYFESAYERVFMAVLISFDPLTY